MRVLDGCCGFNETLGYYAARGYDVYGVEADENIFHLVAKFGYKVHVGPFDNKVHESDFFDYVPMDQVIEYVTDPLTTHRQDWIKSGVYGTALFFIHQDSVSGAQAFFSHGTALVE